MSERADAGAGNVVLGVDGCRAGWVVAAVALTDEGPARIAVDVVPRFGELLARRPRAGIIAVDMPIGLPARLEPGGRACDRAVRALLGRPRGSSVFSPPTRRLLAARDYEAVRQHGVTVQAFHLFAKIREIDEELQRLGVRTRRRVREAHPEAAFAERAGMPMCHAKRTPEGLRERLRVLRGLDELSGVSSALREARAQWPRRAVAPDDILDAMVLASVAVRIVRGEARRLPVRPPRDARGLPMEIWF